MRTIVFGMQPGEPVVLAVQPMQEKLTTELQAGCERAHFKCLPLTPGQPGPEGKAPALLVAELAPGERRIPEPVLGLLKAQPADVSLLLLSPEPLLRPAVSLQNGRVTLLGPPLNASRLSSRMRVLLAGRSALQADASLSAREYLERQWWVATFGTPAAKGRLPALRQSAAEGLTAVVSAEPPNDAALEKIAQRMRREEPDAEKEKGLAELVGAQAGVIHLGPGAERWIVYWPSADWPLSIYSPLRLPNYCELSAGLPAGGSKLMRLNAAAGDLVFALAGGKGAPERAALAAAMAEGGPAAMDLLGAKAKGSGAAVFGLAVEVR